MIFVCLLFLVILAGFSWGVLAAYFLCRNTEYPCAEELEGVKKVLGVQPLGRGSLVGFRITEGEATISAFDDRWTGFINFDQMHAWKFRDVQASFKLRMYGGLVEFHEKGELVGTISTTGFWKIRKKIHFLGSAWELRYPLDWWTDIEVLENGKRIAQITFEPSMGSYRRRKVCLFEDVDVRREMMLSLIAAFSRPRYGNLVQD